MVEECGYKSWWFILKCSNKLRKPSEIVNQAASWRMPCRRFLFIRRVKKCCWKFWWMWFSKKLRSMLFSLMDQKMRKLCEEERLQGKVHILAGNILPSGEYFPPIAPHPWEDAIFSPLCLMLTWFSNYFAIVLLIIQIMCFNSFLVSGFLSHQKENNRSHPLVEGFTNRREIFCQVNKSRIFPEFWFPAFLERMRSFPAFILMRKAKRSFHKFFKKWILNQLSIKLWKYLENCESFLRHKRIKDIILSRKAGDQNSNNSTDFWEKQNRFPIEYSFCHGKKWYLVEFSEKIFVSRIPWEDEIFYPFCFMFSNLGFIGTILLESFSMIEKQNLLFHFETSEVFFLCRNEKNRSHPLKIPWDDGI